MKYATVSIDGRQAVAIVSPRTDEAWLVEDLLGRPAGSMIELIADHDSVKASLVPHGPARPLSGLRIEAPIPRPARNIMCVGKNYHAHALEFTRSGFDSSAKTVDDAVPAAPIIFTKAPETVIANATAIRYPHGISNCVDYEAELGVVIGRAGRGISKAEAYGHVFGYTIINDVTARDLQNRHKQWFLGKSIDTFCPMGPWLVTADEVDPEDLHVQCWVNDELRQDANTRDLIFGIPALIETISACLTLLPGDIIATGTPAGVGIGFTPPKYLVPGDTMTIEIAGLGRLTSFVA